jgi:hypothetical protein
MLEGRKPVKWPLKPESGNDYDGRIRTPLV